MNGDLATSGSLWLEPLAILSAAAFSPAYLLASQIVGFPHPARLVAMAVGLWAVALGLFWAFLLLGLDRAIAAFGTMAFTIVAVRGAPLTRSLGVPIGVSVGLLVVASTMWVLFRIGRSELSRFLVVAAAVMLMSVPAVALLDSVGHSGHDSVVAAVAPHVRLHSRPDVFLVVLDGYAGSLAAKEMFDATRPLWLDVLGQRGFQTPPAAFASYSFTAASIPSILNMSYPLDEGVVSSPEAEGHLYRMVSGDNAIRAVFEENGYQTLFVESGWSGSKCGPAYDHCVMSGFFDAATGRLLDQSILGPVASTKAWSPFTFGALRSMRWGVENVRRLVDDDQPQFVMLHILAPHPPLYLDEDCMTVPSARRSGLNLPLGGVPIDERRDAYIGQMQCVDSFMAAFADEAGVEPLVVFVADHGSDSLGQLWRHPKDWTRADILERFNALLAVRGGVECDLGAEVFLANLFRSLLSCMSEQRIEPLEGRSLLYPSRHLGFPYPVTALEIPRVVAN